MGSCCACSLRPHNHEDTDKCTLTITYQLSPITVLVILCILCRTIKLTNVTSKKLSFEMALKYMALQCICRSEESLTLAILLFFQYLTQTAYALKHTYKCSIHVAESNLSYTVLFNFCNLEHIEPYYLHICRK